MAFDIPNWLALLLEIVIAIPFAIYLYTKQRKISKQLEKVIFEEERLRKLRYDFGIISIKSYLEGLKETLQELNSELESYVEKDNPDDNMKSLKKIWNESKILLSHYVENLKNTVNVVADVLDPIESQQVLAVCMKISEPIIDIPDREFHTGYCTHTINKINNILDYLNKKDERKSPK